MTAKPRVGLTWSRRAAAWLLALACLGPAPAAFAAATGPFGAGLPDDVGFTGSYMFPKLFGLLIAAQTYFNQHLTAAVRALRHDTGAIWILLGISFLYGIVHAAGPGHGKAVVSSYVLANRQTLRNGVILAFIASLAQALGAIILILVASLALHMTSVSITQMTYQFEIGSDLLIVLLGVWLVWTKVVQPSRSLKLAFQPVNALTRPDLFLSETRGAAASRFQAIDVAATAPSMGFSGLSRFKPAPAAAIDDCDCGNLHMPDASIAAGGLDFRKAWTVIASTALRPCTGALIVLVFSISQKVIWAGVLSTLVMGLGTAITVAVLAVLAVSARGTASIVAGADGDLGRAIKRWVEIAGAFAVLAFGALMFTANMFMQ